MKRLIQCIASTSFALAVTAAGAFAQAPAKPQEKPNAPAEQKAPAATEKVTVVFLGNETCTQTGKPVDRTKFVEADGQRVYMCCDKCGDGVKKDTKAALAKAYPTATKVVAKNCACGKAVEAGKGTDVTFQGHTVALCSPACADEFKKNPVSMIVVMMHPTAKDAKNANDPIDGKPVDSTVVAIYKGHIVHFASWANIAAFEKDPAAAMKKLNLSS